MVKELIQVLYDINDLETKKGESKVLVKSTDKLSCKNLTYYGMRFRRDN